MSVLEVRTLRELLVSSADGSTSHVSAASGLVRLGQRLYVVADDDNHLAMFDLRDEGGRLFRLFEGEPPLEPKDRKAAKADLESLMHLPPSAEHPAGSLLAIGSGSRPNRQRAVLLALDEVGEPQGPPRDVDFAPLFMPLRSTFDDLNVEGAFLAGGDMCVLHRRNRRSPVNACIRFDWPAFEHWLFSGGAVPRATSITQLDLGVVDGVPLCFTDGAALPDGGWVFCAAAEDTADSYADARCAGSAVGIVSPTGELHRLELLSLRCKAEGIAVGHNGGSVELLLVTDADDRDAPAILLSAKIDCAVGADEVLCMEQPE
jgi:hypothetical protein